MRDGRTIVALLLCHAVFSRPAAASPAITDPLAYDARAAAAKPAGKPAPKASQPYEGQWASTAKDCRDEDGVNRMEISGGGKRFFWYETRCRATEIKPEGSNAWRMRLSCEGEGDRFRVRPLISLPAPNRLVFTEDPPVGQTKRQAYVRCKE